jgi:hypothetical protein
LQQQQQQQQRRRRREGGEKTYMGKYGRGYSSMKYAVSEGKGKTERPIDLHEQTYRNDSQGAKTRATTRKSGR